MTPQDLKKLDIRDLENQYKSTSRIREKEWDKFEAYTNLLEAAKPLEEELGHIFLLGLKTAQIKHEHNFKLFDAKRTAVRIELDLRNSK